MSEHRGADVTIVGAGIAGLWSAKELVDQGAQVTLIERSKTLADGATTRNEGWLHAGTYHSVALNDPVDAAQVTARTIYGHNRIVEFAPECIDHFRTFAFSGDDDLTHRAVNRWDTNGVEYYPLRTSHIPDEGLNLRPVKAAFAVRDKSVNSVALCTKLARYVVDRGGQIIADTTFRPIDDTTAELQTGDGDPYRIRSDRFLLTAGVGIKQLLTELTGTEPPMRYFQAHLLVTPRLTKDNYFYIDAGEAGIMSHVRSSIIGINRDGIERTDPSYEIVPEKERLVGEALLRLLPRAAIAPVLGTVACCKPDLYRTITDTQSLNVQVSEVVPNYVFALPGKMTEAPFLARTAAEHVLGHSIGERPTVLGQSNIAAVPAITMRPADRWTTDHPPLPPSQGVA